MSELLRLTDRHKSIVSLTLRGFSRRQIAQALGIAENSLVHIVNASVFQSELARRQANIQRIEDESIANNVALAREVIQRESLPAAMKLAEISQNSPDQNLQLRASEKILNLAFGGTSGSGGTTVNQVVMINTERVNQLFQIAKEAGLEAALAGSNDDSGTDGTSGDGSGTGSLAEAG